VNRQIVRLLLDTHAVLWWFSDDLRLSTPARAAIANPGNQLAVSAAVGYEIAYKQNLGRLPALPERLPDRLRREGVGNIAISLDHALAAAALPGPHRDPWDRIMMAQALAERWHMVTADPVFAKYGVPVLW
jgi:PIN domain nuclease of toxin-antitoxin system